MKKSTKSIRVKGQRGAASVADKVGRVGKGGDSTEGRRLQNGLPTGSKGRGSSIQGERQSAKGGNAGANQGGASRGASRLEPSTLKKGTGRVSGKRQHTKKTTKGQ